MQRSRENRKPTTEPRDDQVRIRVSKTEKAMLGKLAAAAGVSIGAYMVGCALGDAIADQIVGQKPDPDQVRLDLD